VSGFLLLRVSKPKPKAKKVPNSLSFRAPFHGMGPRAKKGVELDLFLVCLRSQDSQPGLHRIFGLDGSWSSSANPPESRWESR
jgi:hypothetical protein